MTDFGKNDQIRHAVIACRRLSGNRTNSAFLTMDQNLTRFSGCKCCTILIYTHSDDVSTEIHIETIRPPLLRQYRGKRRKAILYAETAQPLEYGKIASTHIRRVYSISCIAVTVFKINLT